MNAFRRVCRLGLALLIMAPAWAVETGTLLKADAMRAAPFGDAKLLATLPAGTKVTILKQSSGWLQVKSAKLSGWVRMLSIRKGAAPKKAGAAAGVLGLASGRAGTGKVVATTGIRGLNEEDELKLAESFATSGADARTFAAKGKLVARPFSYLSAPQ